MGEPLSLIYRCATCGGAVMWVVNTRRGREFLGHVIKGETGQVRLYLGRLETHARVEPCTCSDED